MLCLIMYQVLSCIKCDGMHSCTSCTPGPGPQYLVYTYVDMVTCARYRSCRVITYDWRERLDIECCARQHVFNCGLELAVRCDVCFICRNL